MGEWLEILKKIDILITFSEIKYLRLSYYSFKFSNFDEQMDKSCHFFLSNYNIFPWPT